jgi:hypothetical protein
MVKRPRLLSCNSSQMAQTIKLALPYLRADLKTLLAERTHARTHKSQRITCSDYLRSTCESSTVLSPDPIGFGEEAVPNLPTLSTANRIHLRR